MTIRWVLLGVAASSALGAQESASPATRTATPLIVATGRGVLRLKPDRATATIAVVTRSKTAMEAAAQNAPLMRAVADSIRRVIGTGADVTTSSFGMEPDWRYEGNPTNRVQVGFVVRNSIRVEVRNLERLSAVLDAALAAGATQITGVQFGITKDAEAALSALDSAVVDATRRARVLARASGGGLGALIELSTPDRLDVPLYALAASRLAMEATPSTPVTPAEVVVTAQVTGRWQFVPTPK